MPFVNAGSQLIRNAWVMKGLIQAKSKSFWAPYTGMNKDAVVVQSNNSNAKEGHNVVFDYDGNLSGKPIKGKNTAAGKGEQKKKFSDNVIVQRYRLPVDNGDSFDGVDIGDLNITQHSDSRSKLADLWVRVKDQTIFDSAQGNFGQAPTHKIDLGSSLTYNDLLAIEATVQTGIGYAATFDSARRPPEPYRLSNGEAVWLFLVDTAMASKLKQDSDYQTIVINADVRGANNMAISGVIGKLGKLLIVEVNQFYGETDVTVGNWDIENTAVEIQGLRQYDAGNSKWTGQAGFDNTATLTSNGLVMGARAMMLGMGKNPDYKFEESKDFKITSESALEVWFGTQKVKLVKEKEDYVSAKVADVDNGIIVVETDI